MKNNKFLFLSVIICLILFNSCELDNYDSPNASLSGNIIDAETGELVQSDILEGTMIKIVEHGYDPVSPQYLRVKNDGTYANTLLFANTYTVQPDVRNFIQIEEQEVKIGENTKLDFHVVPYIRVKNVSLSQEGNNITATFQLEQTTSDAVKKIGLYVSDQPIVGQPARIADVEKDISKQVEDNEVFKLVINTARSSNLKSGESYYFRIGAVSSFTGARFNYAPMQRINIGEIIPEEGPKSQVMDQCEGIDGWGGSNPITLDSEAQEGSHSVKASVNPGGAVIFQKTYGQPFDTEVSIENGYFAFSLYISDISQINWENTGSSIEITSSGIPDVNELAWDFNKSLGLRNGWNQVKLKLSDAHVGGGNIDLHAVNYLRIFHLEINGSLEMKIDNIRFYEEL